MLPVIGEAQLHQGFQECIPNSLFGPMPEANLNGIPFAVPFVHVARWATDAHDVKHAIQKTLIVLRRPCPAQASPSGRVQAVIMVKLSPIPLCSDRLAPILPPLERQS
jgi:hypothetical protein